MVSQVKQQQIYLPTGYEGLQHQAAAKRRLAETMTGLGLTPEANQQSILQVLGKMAQQFVGRRAEKQADKLDLQYRSEVGKDYQSRASQFYADAKVLNPQDLVAKWGTDPLVGELAKPYQEVATAGMKDAQQFGYHDGQTWMRKGDIAPGTYKPNDMNSKVIRGPDGNSMVNPLAVTAAIASQGIPVSDGTYSMADPARGGQVPGMPQPQTQQVAQTQGFEAVTMEQLAGMQQALGPKGTADWLMRNKVPVKVTTPQEAMQLPSGTKLILPDGSEGEVP